MKSVLRILGGFWIAGCAALWLWINLHPVIHVNGGGSTFSLSQLMVDSQFGLTGVPLVLAIPGAYLWGLGKRRN